MTPDTEKSRKSMEKTSGRMLFEVCGVEKGMAKNELQRTKQKQKTKTPQHGSY